MTAMLGQYTMMVLSEQKTLTIVIYELPNTQGYRESCCSPAEFHHQRKELCIFIWWLPNNHSVLHNKPTSFITRMAFLGQKDRHVQWRQRVFFPGDSQVGVTGRMCRKVEPWQATWSLSLEDPETGANLKSGDWCLHPYLIADADLEQTSAGLIGREPACVHWAYSQRLWTTVGWSQRELELCMAFVWSRL